ncbi:MAG: hypothetical protein K0S65_6041 [Labilithrix sp.]|nr:hypothetical protein [Labilithrix sp.]
MSHLDLEPLVRGDSDPLERIVLGSARGDVPAPDAKAQLLAALARASAPPSDVPCPPSLLSRFGGRYTPGIALLVGASAAAIMSMVTAHREPPLASASSEVALVVAPSSIVEPPAALPSAPADPPATAPPAKPVVRRKAPAAETAPKTRLDPSAEPVADSTLGREIERVGAARSALAAGEPGRTLSLLDAYDAEFPKGTFSVEVSVLRIEALARSGRVDEARRLGERFLSQHPEGAFARRITATLQNIAPATPDSTLASPRD